MNLDRFEIKELFGAFHHIIDLNESGVTLVLGENGLGKTQILRLLEAFFNGNFLEIQSVLFSELTLHFHPKKVIKVLKILTNDGVDLQIKEFEGRKKLNEYTLNFSNMDRFRRRRAHSLHKYSRSLSSSESYHELEYFISKLHRPVERIGGDSWIDHTAGNVYSTSELVDKFSAYLPEGIRAKFSESMPEWLTGIINSQKTKFIETQRLLTKIGSEKEQYKSSVINYSNELVETIKNKRVEAIDLASRLDRTYPNRLIKRSSQVTKISDQDLQNAFTLLEQNRDLLNQVGLIDTEEEYIQPIQSRIKTQSSLKREILKDVLHIYIEDSNQKLSIYEDLARKIELLIEIINKRFLHKKLSIDKNKGFVFTSTHNGNTIPISGLSSGEQHELVLFFQLLFTTSPNSLLLIDEPEISLHISWQKAFIDDIKQVIEVNNLYVIIATHSPDIIGNYWDLTVQLKGS